MRVGRALVVLLLAGCGTGPFAGEGGGDDHLPVSGVGPYRKLAADFSTPADEPYLLAERRADLRDPSALWREDGGVRLWFGREDDAGSEIWAAELPALRELPDVEPTPALVADQAWEQGRIAAPSVVDPGDGTLVLYYQGGTSELAIGRAVSDDDGATWRKDAEPVLRDAASPGAATLEGELWGLAFVRPDEPGILFAGSDDGVHFVIGAAPAVEARPGRPDAFDRDDVADPALVVRRTRTGEARWGLVYVGVGGRGEALAAIGYAGSDDGSRWVRAFGDDPILAGAAPSETGPALLRAADRAVLLFTEQRVGRARIAAAVHP